MARTLSDLLSGAQVTVIQRKSDKSSIEGYGAPDEFLNKISNLLGEQVFKGRTLRPSLLLPPLP